MIFVFWLLLVLLLLIWALFLVGMAYHTYTRFRVGRAYYWQPTPRHTHTPLDHYKTIKMSAIRRQRGNGK